MLDFGPSNYESELLRDVTQTQLRTPFPDDNGLLDYLRKVEYLESDIITGYLPAGLYYYHGVPDVAEIMLDAPLGETSLTHNGGPKSTYESPHYRLQAVHGHRMNGILGTDSGNGIELKTGERFFMPKSISSLNTKIRHGRLAASAISAACKALNFEGTVSSEDYISSDYEDIMDLSFTRAIRIAAGWAAYALKKPWDADAQENYPRILSADEIVHCLKIGLDAHKAEIPKRDIDIIHEVIGSN